MIFGDSYKKEQTPKKSKKYLQIRTDMHKVKLFARTDFQFSVYKDTVLNLGGHNHNQIKFFEYDLFQ